MTSSFLNYSAENSLTGTVVPAASCRQGMCTKTKTKKLCQRQTDGSWQCSADGATEADSCYEDWTSNGECKAIEFQACAGVRGGYPDCA